MSFKVPENSRMKFPEGHQFHTNYGDLFGCFLLQLGAGERLFCIASAGTEEMPWEHVSVSVKTKALEETDETPSWEEMCMVKEKFWDPEDCVVQFHPPEAEYINTHNHCLHLWKKHGENIETPPNIMV